MNRYFTAAGLVHVLASRTHGPRPTIVESEWSGDVWSVTVAGSCSGDMEHRSVLSIRLAHLEIRHVDAYEYQVFGYPMDDMKINDDDGFPVLLKFTGQKILLMHAAKQPPHAKLDAEGFAPIHRFSFEKDLELPDPLDPFTLLPHVLGSDHWTVKWALSELYPFPYMDPVPTMRVLSIRDGYLHGQVVRGMKSERGRMRHQYYEPFVQPMLINRISYSIVDSMPVIVLSGMPSITHGSLRLMSMICTGTHHFSREHPEIMKRLIGPSP